MNLDWFLYWHWSGNGALGVNTSLVNSTSILSSTISSTISSTLSSTISSIISSAISRFSDSNNSTNSTNSLESQSAFDYTYATPTQVRMPSAFAEFYQLQVIPFMGNTLNTFYPAVLLCVMLLVVTNLINRLTTSVLAQYWLSTGSVLAKY